MQHLGSIGAGARNLVATRGCAARTVSSGRRSGRRAAGWVGLWAAVGLAGAGCGSKGSDGEPACPPDIIALVGAAEWSSLEGAIGSVSQGASVEVDLCPGTFDTRTAVVGIGAGWDRVVLRGHPDGTVLDGGGAGTVLDFEGNGIVELADLTIRGGYADAGGGGYRGRGNQTLILDGVRFEGNQAPADGGAVRLVSGPDGGVIVEDSGSASATFADNHAGGSGGAISLSGEGYAAFSPGGWQFDGNSAGVHGGAVSVESGDVLGVFGDFAAAGNVAGGDGGALYVDGRSGAGLFLGRVDAADNRAGDYGGVVRLAAGASGDLSIASGELSGNLAEGGGGLAVASGWAVSVATTAVQDNSPDDVRFEGDGYLGADLGDTFTCQPGAGCVSAR